MSALPQPFIEPLSALSDAELDSTIVLLGGLMLAAEKRYQEYHHLADKGDRDRYWHQQRLVLEERARRPHLVAAMEQERGLA